MLACLCCKKGDIGFKEFENTEGEEYQADFSTLASPASQNGPEVYILPLTEVSLPVSKQPGRSVQLLKSTDLGRHSLLYLKEIGHGWFGKVLLGEVNSGLSTTQVVVKELKASASVQDQMQFLEEAQPYRALQHPALLQCLAQCTEVTPYLLVMEFCPLGDLKGYLRSCRAADSMTPDPLTLQRMACEIASGLLHLHKHNYVHSDLALRNCLLTAEVTVKIGDYGLSHNKYKDDYFVTSDQIWVPLRWIAPELIDEVHGNLLVVDQTKPSNIWSLGVTIWELFELGNQPYHHYSDRQVLTYAIKEQQLKLPKPLLKVPLSDRWYEVMQFCWLQPDQRPTAEEVHLLLSYLCAKGASEAEEDFEKRWNSLRPNGGNSGSHSAGASVAEMPSSSSSSFPLLEHFSAGDGFHSEPGDDILTVTETSRGLNFEYKWEQALPEQHFLSSCGGGGLTLGVSPSYYDSKQLHTPGVVPVLSAHSPSLNSEYYIRIEEPSECNIDLEYTMCSYSPEFDGNFVEGSNTSPVISLTMEPLLGQVTSANAVEPWVTGHGQYFSYKVRDREQSYYYENSPSDGADQYLAEDPSEMHQESWGSRSLRQALGELENPLGISPSLSSPQPVYCDPYLEGSHETIHSKSAAGDLNFVRRPGVNTHDAYVDFHFTVPSEDLEDPLSGSVIRRSYALNDNIKEKKTEFVGKEKTETTHSLPEGESVSENSHTVDSGVEKGYSSISLVEIDDCSDDDITDVTSGVFSDFPMDYANIEDSAPTFKSLQKQVGTPDSIDSLDLPSTTSSCEAFSPATFRPSSQPKAVDSGYDTENNESPEFVLKEPHEPRDPDVDEEANTSVSLSTSHGTELELTGLNKKNPYRDSAYFSDYDAEIEKFPRDEGDDFTGQEAKKEDLASSTEREELSPLVNDEEQQQGCELGEQKTDRPVEINKDEISPRGLGLESDHSGEEQSSECSSSSVSEGPTQQEPPASSDPGKGIASIEDSPAESLSDETARVEGDGNEMKEVEETIPAVESSPSCPPEKEKAPEELLHEDHETQENEVQEMLEASKALENPALSSPPQDLQAIEGRVSPADGEEADEEDGDSEDSEESDEELRCYNIQEQSEESEEEFPSVPIVVSNSSEAQNLRSLLKMPSLLSQSFCEEMDRKKKAVSFFDDVTVYLFDQESPTRELGEHSFPPGEESGGRNSDTGETHSQERVSDDSSDGNVSEESGGFEWDDDFPLMPVSTSLVPSKEPPVTSSLPTRVPEPKLTGSAVQYSRFTVSPSSVSRFSITHVSDSDIDSAGGRPGSTLLYNSGHTHTVHALQF
ncbi:LMTK1 kinase, partial [Atractosteus spatula]|nr:LMTK1 kinase [Atractosteus spatula]